MYHSTALNSNSFIFYLKHRKSMHQDIETCSNQMEIQEKTEFVSLYTYLDNAFAVLAVRLVSLSCFPDCIARRIKL